MLDKSCRSTNIYSKVDIQEPKNEENLGQPRLDHLKYQSWMKEMQLSWIYCIISRFIMLCMEHSLRFSGTSSKYLETGTCMDSPASCGWRSWTNHGNDSGPQEYKVRVIVSYVNYNLPPIWHCMEADLGLRRTRWNLYKDLGKLN